MEDRIEQFDSDYEYPDEDEDEDIFEKTNPFRQDVSNQLNINNVITNKNIDIKNKINVNNSNVDNINHKNE